MKPPNIRTSLLAGRQAFKECYDSPVHGALSKFVEQIARSLNVSINVEELNKSEQATTPHSNYAHISETIKQINSYAPRRDRSTIMNTYVGIAHEASAYAEFHHDTKSGARFIAVDMRLSQLFNSYAKGFHLWDLIWNTRGDDNEGGQSSSRLLREDHIEEFWRFLDSEASEWLHGPKVSTTRLYRSIPEDTIDRNMIDSISECAEEFVIAHEFMHALKAERPRSEALSGIDKIINSTLPKAERSVLNDSQIEEITCDIAALRLCIDGRRKVNRNPELAIAGALVALTTIAHYNRDWSTAPPEKYPSQTHPSIVTRASSIWKYGTNTLNLKIGSRDVLFAKANMLSNAMTFIIAGAIMDSHRKQRITDPAEHFDKLDYLKQDLLVQVLSSKTPSFFGPTELGRLAHDGTWPSGDFLKTREAINSILEITLGWKPPSRRS